MNSKLESKTENTRTPNASYNKIYIVLCLSYHFLTRLFFNQTLSCLITSPLLRIAYVLKPFWMRAIDQQKAKNLNTIEEMTTRLPYCLLIDSLR